MSVELTFQKRTRVSNKKEEETVYAPDIQSLQQATPFDRLSSQK